MPGAAARPRCAPAAPSAAARTTGKGLRSGHPRSAGRGPPATLDAFSGVPASRAPVRSLPRGRDDDRPHGAIETPDSRALRRGRRTSRTSRTQGLAVTSIHTALAFSRGSEPEEDRTDDA